jgi:hypothetical protein
VHLSHTHTLTRTHTTANTAMPGNAPTTQELLAVQLASAMHTRTHTRTHNCKHGNVWQCAHDTGAAGSATGTCHAHTHNCKHGNAWQCAHDTGAAGSATGTCHAHIHACTQLQTRRCTHAPTSQELLAVQLVHAFSEVFQDAGLPLRLRHYDVLVTSNRCGVCCERVLLDALY